MSDDFDGLVGSSPVTISGAVQRDEPATFVEVKRSIVEMQDTPRSAIIAVSSSDISTFVYKEVNKWISCGKNLQTYSLEVPMCYAQTMQIFKSIDDVQNLQRVNR